MILAQIQHPLASRPLAELPANQFSIAVSPLTYSFRQGVSAEYVVTLTLVAGAAETATMTYAGLADDVTAEWDTDSISTDGGVATLTITAGASAPAVTADPFTVTATATSQTKRKTARVTVELNDFTVAVSDDTDSIVQGDSAAFTITLAKTTGNAVTTSAIVVSGLPSGVTAEVADPTISTDGGTTTCTLTASGSATLGADVFLVTVTTADAVRTDTGSVTITGLVPVNTIAPEITGTLEVDDIAEVLNTGSWDNSPTSYTYQWTREGDDIVGETASTYTVVEADAGLVLACLVRAHNAAGASAPGPSNLVTVGGGAQAEFYVSALGNDSNAGTIGLPWLTVAKVNATSFAAGDTVYFRGGDRFSDAILAPTSSGSSGNPITFSSYGTGKAVVSGGLEITTWTQTDATKNIWRASLADTAGRPRALWVDGERCVRAFKHFPSGATITGTGISTAASADPGFLDGYVNPSDIEIVFRALWAEHHVPVTSISGNDITIQAEAFDRLEYMFYSILTFLDIEAAIFGVENSKEIFEANAATRTFYHDRANDYIYLIPPAGVADPNSSEVIAGISERLLEMDGVDDVVFDNLAFSHTTNLRPSATGGFIDVQVNCTQANATEHWRFNLPDVAVFIEDGARVKFLNCEFTKLGNCALHLFGPDVLNCEVAGNWFSDVSGTAIFNGNPDYLTSGVDESGPGGTWIHDNLIERCGVEYAGAGGIVHFFGSDTLIEYNTLRDLPYVAISVGWGWQFGGTRLNDGNITQRNRIYRCMQVSTDGGGVYSNGFHQSHLIDSNYISDLGRASTSFQLGDFYAPGLYLDDGSENVTVTNNVQHGIGGVNAAMYKGQDNIASDNTADSGNWVEVSSTGTNTMEALQIATLADAITAGNALATGVHGTYAGLLTAHPDPTPGDYRNGIVFELLPENSSSSGSTTSIVRAVDSVGRRDLFQATSGSRLSFVPAELNSKPVFRTAGDSAFSGDIAAPTNSITLMAVVKVTDAADRAIAFVNGNGASNGIGLINNNANRAVVFGGVGYREDGAQVVDTWEIWTYQRDRSNVSTFRANGLAASLGGSGTPVLPQDFIELSGDSADIAAVRIYDHAIGATRARQVEELLAAEFGLTLATLELVDTFTGTGDLSAHTSDNGYSWSSMFGGSGSEVVLASGAAYSVAFNSEYVSSFTPETANAGLTITVNKGTIDTPANIGGWLRVANPGSSAVSGYLGRYSEVDGWEIYRLMPSISYTLLGTTAGSLADGDTLTFTVSGTGATVTLTLLKNGVQQLQVTDTSGDRFTANGQVGIHFVNNSGASTDNYSAESIAAE